LLSTVADSEVDEEPGRGPGVRGFESLRSPKGGLFIGETSGL
jgi:hypothetical protein